MAFKNNFKPMFMLDSEDDAGSESGYGSETAQTTETTETTEKTGDTGNSAAANAKSDAGAADQTAKTDDQSKQTADKENVTGYESKEDDKGEAKDKAVTDDKPLELDAKGLGEDAMKTVHEFAKEQKLSKEQAQAFVDKLKATEDAKAVSAETRKTQEAEVHTKWVEELKADPDFGGQNFSQSVHNVNKFIREEMPGLKNILTTTGKRLPPSLMKDLNNVYRRLHGETTLTEGQNGGKKDSWHPTDFYKQKQ